MKGEGDTAAQRHNNSRGYSPRPWKNTLLGVKVSVSFSPVFVGRFFFFFFQLLKLHERLFFGLSTFIRHSFYVTLLFFYTDFFTVSAGLRQNSIIRS